MGEAKKPALRMVFDRKVKLGSKKVGVRSCIVAFQETTPEESRGQVLHCSFTRNNSSRNATMQDLTPNAHARESCSKREKGLKNAGLEEHTAGKKMPWA
jgi:hypothetical protein